MTIIVTVDCSEGEDRIQVSEISLEILEYINPLLLEIRKNNGYWVSGEKLVPPDPGPFECYGSIYGSEVIYEFFKYLPSPLHGIERISEINVFSETPITLYM